MAEDFAIGRALVIPKDVLSNLDEVDKKINKIATDSENMATKFTASMSKMSTGTGDLLKKLTEMQTKINNMDISKFAQGVSNVAKGVSQIEKFSNAISKAAASINKYNSSQVNKKNVDNTKEINRLNKEIEALKKKTEQLEQYRQKQQQVNREQSSTRTNTKAIDAYNRAMASSEAIVTQRINKIAKLRQAEEMLTKASGDYSVQIKRIRQEIERLNKLNQGQVDAYGRIIKSQRNLMDTSGQLERKLALIFSVSQIEGYIMKLVKVRGEFELQNTALASILQNKDQADKLFGQITELAVKSPFTVKELTTYTKSLSAYSVEYEKLYDTTKMLADVSAGLGVDMQRLILAFGQVKAANFLRGTETRQFTEAGINMLGELAKYYTELEGRIVSVSEVQDRQFKKMISFQDVEQVFKRLTSAGGMFYNMQEKQAETIAGQMSNLQDTIDLMLNDIGKANDSTIRLMLSTIKSIVENWEILANVIKTAGTTFALYYVKVMLASAANGAFAKSTIAATVAQGGLVGATGKVINAIKSLATIVKSNPFLAIASAVTLAGYELYDHAKKVEENKKAYDVFTNSVKQTQTEFGKITSRVTEQNQKIKETLEKVSSLKKGTKEYSDAENEANKQREKMSTLLEELNSKFPDVYESIIKQKDGTVDLTEAQALLNEQLERTTYLSYLSRQTETFWSDGLVENIKDASEAQQKYKLSSDDLSNAYTQMTARIKEYFATNKYASKDLQKQLDEIANSSLSTADKIEKMYSVVRNVSGVNIGDLRRIIYDYQDEAQKSIKANKELEESNSNLSKSIEQVANGYKLAFDTTSEEGRKSAKAATEEFIRLLDIKNEAVREFVRSQFEITIGVKLNIDNKATPELSDMEKRINEYLDNMDFTLVPKIDAGEGTVKFFNELKEEYKSLTEEAEKIKRASQELYPDQTNAQRLEEINNKMVQVKTTLKDWGELEEKKNKTTKDDSAIKRLKEQISLIKKASDEYEKLRKYYSEEEATAKIRESFKDAFSNLSLSTQIDFDVNGVIKALEALNYKVVEGGKEAVDEVVAPLKAQQDIDVRVKGLNEIQKQLDEVFAGYELSVELKEVGVDANLLGSILGINSFSLDDVKKQVEPLKEMLIKSFGDSGEDLSKEIDSRISNYQKKEIQELIKSYSSVSATFKQQRENIKTEYDKVLQYILAGKNETNASQIDKIADIITNNYKKAIAKINWEEFKTTSDYGLAFGNLDSVSTSALNRVYKSINKFKQDAISNQDASNVKEYVSAMEQLFDKILERGNAFDNLNIMLKEYNISLENLKQAEVDYQKALDEYDSKYETSDEIRKKQLIDNKTNAYEKLSDATNRYYLSIDNLNKAEKRAEQIFDEFSDSVSSLISSSFGSDAASQFKSILDVFDSAKDAFDLFTKSMQETTANTAEKMLEAGSKSVESIGNVSDGVSKAIENTSKAAATSISAVEKASVILTVISAAIQVFNELSSVESENYEEHQAYLQGIIELQIEYNKSLMEAKLLHDDVFGSNPFGNIVDDIKTAQEAMNNYNEAANEMQVQWKDPEHGGFFGRIWKGFAKAIGSLDIFDLGWGDAIENGVGGIVDVVNGVNENLVKAIENLRYITQHGSKGFLGIGSKGTKTQDLREWVKRNLGADLFDENGLINLDIVNELLNSHANNLTDDTKNTLEELKTYAEIIEDVEDSITDWATDVFGDLSSNLSSALVDSFRNGMSAADDFKTHVSSILETLGEQMVQNMLYNQVLSQYQGQLEELTKKYALGNMSEEEYMNSLAALVGNIMGSADAFIGVGEDFLEKLKEAAKEYGYDIFLPDENGDTMSSLQRGISSISEETAQALEALLNSMRFFVSDSNTVLHNIYNAIAMPNVENPFLAELKVQSEQLRLLYGLFNGIIKNVSGSGKAMSVRIV